MTGDGCELISDGTADENSGLSSHLLSHRDHREASATRPPFALVGTPAGCKNVGAVGATGVAAARWTDSRVVSNPQGFEDERTAPLAPAAHLDP
ncbi:hypothetical protein R1sor_000145 [Riccia sorocarpa]|uniref:Uncharacterized protein n=1 Tax=Riccia sorocarpa TaxID=122646 RepID=A0ABD3GSH8_9MARC